MSIAVPKDPALYTRSASSHKVVMNTRRRLRAAHRLLLAETKVTAKTIKAEKAEARRTLRAATKVDSALVGCQDRSFL